MKKGAVIEPAVWAGEEVEGVASGAARFHWSARRGGKIVSLTGPDGMEWLTQPAHPLPPPARGGAAFVEAEMCGWDECAPSILPCEVGGVRAGDHGNYWTLPWERHGAWLSAFDPASRVTLSRRVMPLTRAGATGFRVEYRASAESRTPFLWPAHPQFQAPPGSWVELPGAPVEVVDVIGGEERVARTDALSRIDTLPPGGMRKHYVPPEFPVSSARLHRGDGQVMELRWDMRLCPYVGSWFERAAFAREDVIAIEPSTGWFDSLAEAVRRGRVAWTPAAGHLSWWVELEFGPRGLPGAPRPPRSAKQRHT
jgi:hypothetical protein